MRSTAIASRYAASMWVQAAKLRCRSGLMTGNATETIEPSSGPMKAPIEVSASSSQRRRCASSSVMRLSSGTVQPGGLRHPGDELVKAGARALEGVGRRVGHRRAERDRDHEALAPGAGQQPTQQVRIADHRGGDAGTEAAVVGGEAHALDERAGVEAGVGLGETVLEAEDEQAGRAWPTSS